MLPALVLAAVAATPPLFSPGAAPPLKPVVAEVVSRGSRQDRRLALTFDACSTHQNQFDERITKILVESHTPATIFLGGEWTRANEEHVRYLASLPRFELENHTWSHPHMTKLPVEQLRGELLETQAEVYQVTGREPRFWRAPFGEYDTKVVETAAKLGLTTIQYALPSGDPDPHATKERLVDWVLRRARAGDIIVMHLNHTSFHTAEALPAIIAGLEAKGFAFVTVAELVRDERGEPGAAVAAAPK